MSGIIPPVDPKVALWKLTSDFFNPKTNIMCIQEELERVSKKLGDEDSEIINQSYWIPNSKNDDDFDSNGMYRELLTNFDKVRMSENLLGNDTELKNCFIKCFDNISNGFIGGHIFKFYTLSPTKVECRTEILFDYESYPVAAIVWILENYGNDQFYDIVKMVLIASSSDNSTVPKEFTSMTVFKAMSEYLKISPDKVSTKLDVISALAPPLTTGIIDPLTMDLQDWLIEIVKEVSET